MGQSLAIKIINYLFYSLFAVSLILYVVFVIGNSENSEPLLIWTYILSAFAIGTTIIFGFSNVFKSKKSMVTSLIITAVTGLLVAIFYSLASDVIPTNAAGEAIEDVTASASRWSGVALYMLYTLMGVSFASLIFTEIKGAFK